MTLETPILIAASRRLSVFGAALNPDKGQPAAWVVEDVKPVPKNIYGVTKAAAEDLCELFYRTQGLPCIVLRTSRFFPEEDDNHAQRQSFDDLNLKVNEFLHRRVEITDAVDAHLLAAEKAADLGFGRYIISATTPFEPQHLSRLRTEAPQVVRSLFPSYEEEYVRRGWKMFSDIGRVYVNQKACDELGWRPRFSFASVLDRLRRGDEPLSPLVKVLGKKGYHAQRFVDGPYPVDEPSGS